MKPKIAVGILIIFCLAEIRPLLPYLEYYVNYEYISKVLCINKEKPMSTCNGKCHLSQQLNEAQQTEKQDKKIPVVEQERIPMIIYNSELPKFLITVSDAKQYFAFYQFSIKYLSISPPTPPPKC
ncbi:hypothetical protein [Siansivirga zeaxanthinifaciens]|uniref:Uncharacterized protein n=1 Tax=Siansivirga zeaxanthinifaciens CC-SAMT-1 TaxID=1454006 RepID=A0A0C5VZ59_9FLAO|nr:hypothetical protein [Siansivirga zeaxanthinifaciens]AJR04341.1 hypothetical protein AW14_12445 [Siansivirga zeaxanthinifaciens CC-SAMT-1]